jgi:nucleoid-associated protein YgaU
LNLKKLLKNLKLNEEGISMVLGAVVIVIVGILVINYFKDRGSANIPGESTENGNAKEHIVAKGETLWSIAEDNYGSGYNWVDVKEANKLTQNDIEVGQKLVIPSVASKKPTLTQKVTVNKTVEPIAKESYTVVKGDCLWDIAVRAYGDGYKWSEIAKANKLVNPNVIHAGNVFVLPR